MNVYAKKEKSNLISKKIDRKNNSVNRGEVSPKFLKKISLKKSCSNKKASLLYLNGIENKLEIRNLSSDRNAKKVIRNELIAKEKIINGSLSTDNNYVSQYRTLLDIMRYDFDNVTLIRGRSYSGYSEPPLSSHIYRFGGSQDIKIYHGTSKIIQGKVIKEEHRRHCLADEWNYKISVWPASKIPVGRTVIVAQYVRDSTFIGSSNKASLRQLEYYNETGFTFGTVYYVKEGKGWSNLTKAQKRTTSLGQFTTLTVNDHTLGSVQPRTLNQMFPGQITVGRASWDSTSRTFHTVEMVIFYRGSRHLPDSIRNNVLVSDYNFPP